MYKRGPGVNYSTTRATRKRRTSFVSVGVVIAVNFEVQKTLSKLRMKNVYAICTRIELCDFAANTK